ncbi:MBL fold metallo-hydrolase [bacterium]|nr:MBL fold metallo-hydrolase [bacterium]MBU1984301.1 MBL fold metallo-hydrolase [bacterium]
MRIGPYKVSAIEAGDFRLDGGAMFGVVPKVLWNRTNRADELNRIEMVMRCLLIEDADRKILVDSGAGDKEGQKFTDMYAVDNTQNSLLRSLAALAIKPEQITDVIHTHLHFDHAGGSTRLDSGRVVPMFPNARHYVQKRHWVHALNPTDRDRASFFDHNYRPVQEAGLLELVEGDTELFPGVELIVHDGHSPAMQSVRVFGGDSSIWFPADLIPLSVHVPLPYIMGYDLFPMTTLAEKKRLLPRALEEKWILVYEHDPRITASLLTRDLRGQIVRGETVTLL